MSSRSATLMKAFRSPWNQNFVPATREIRPYRWKSSSTWPEALVAEGNTQPRGRTRRRVRHPALTQTVGPPPLEDGGELPGDRQEQRFPGLGLVDPQEAPRQAHPVPAQAEHLADAQAGVEPAPPRIQRLVGPSPPSAESDVLTAPARGPRERDEPVS